MSALGLDEMIARSPQDYVRIATRLAGDPGRLAGLRAGLRRRMAASPRMAHAGLARAVEDAYRAMWRRWCGGEINPS